MHRVARCSSHPSSLPPYFYTRRREEEGGGGGGEGGFEPIRVDRRPEENGRNTEGIRLALAARITIDPSV